MACIDFVGDAQLMFTAPFFPDSDALEYRAACRVPEGGVLDLAGRLVPETRSLDPFLRGSLTYDNPRVDILVQFAGSRSYTTELREAIDRIVGLPMAVTVGGIIFSDGYGAVSVKIEVTDGWEIHRDALIEGFGRVNRDRVGEVTRDLLMPVLAEVSRRCSPGTSCDTLLPYFNLTYVARTTHPRPGRATLPDDLRHLVYPRSPEPITSNSPWSDEFFYAGYAFLLLVSPDPRDTLVQLEHLLLHLDVLYARMDRSAGAADELIRGPSRDGNINWLVALERRLRADYQALVQPTFSYDHHVLKLRDALLHAWDTDKTRERTETVLEMARQAVERQLAEEQARRVSRVNLIITILTLVSFVASIDAAINLWERLF